MCKQRGYELQTYHGRNSQEGRILKWGGGGARKILYLRAAHMHGRDAFITAGGPLNRP